MNKGLTIVMKRMESHPEEFEFGSIFNHGPIKGEADADWQLGNKRRHWQRLIHVLEERNGRITATKSLLTTAPPAAINTTAFLEDEEVTEVLNKFYGLLGDKFTGEVMQTLLAEPEPQEKFFGGVASNQAALTNLAYNQSMEQYKAQNAREAGILGQAGLREEGRLMDKYHASGPTSTALKAGAVTYTGAGNKSTVFDWLAGR